MFITYSAHVAMQQGMVITYTAHVATQQGMFIKYTAHVATRQGMFITYSAHVATQQGMVITYTAHVATHQVYLWYRLSYRRSFYRSKFNLIWAGKVSGADNSRKSNLLITIINNISKAYENDAGATDQQVKLSLT